MIIASWNVNSLTVRLPHVLGWLKSCKPDILCLQETKMVDEKFPVDKFGELGYHSEYCGEKAYNGVAIISKIRPDTVQKGFKTPTEFVARRFLEIQIKDVTVIDVYIPNGSEVGSEKFIHKLEWMKMLKSHLNTYHDPGKKLVLCGDFNVAPEAIDVWDPKQMENQILFSQPEREALDSIKKWGLIDTFRVNNHEPGNYSWWDYRLNAFKRKMGLRIDHIWATKSLSEKCSKSWIDAEPRKLERPSDHAPVVAEFSD